jgi:eukaryotic-like serine/threonine-protein kinase
MKPKNLLLILALLLAAALLSGCSGDMFAASSWPSLLVEEDVSYVSYNQYVYAINVQDGQMRWRYPENGEGARTFYAEPALTDDGQLIVGSYNGNLYSLNPESGTENWVFTQANGRYIGAPLAHGNRIYAPSADHRLYALDLSGNEVWRFEGSRGALWAKPLLDEERQLIYLPSMDHHLYAITVENGQLVWEANLNGSVVGTPVLENGVLYVGSFANSMAAINANNGTILWTTPVTNWVWAGPALHEGRLYFGDLGGSLYSLEARTGRIIWETQPDGPVTATPYIAEGTVYFTTEEGMFKALNLDGTQQWTQPVGGKIYANPTPANDLILVSPINTDPLVVGMNLNGTQRWSFVPPN